MTTDMTTTLLKALELAALLVVIMWSMYQIGEGAGQHQCTTILLNKLGPRDSGDGK